MLDQKSFRELFYDALQLHREEYAVQDERIVKAIAKTEEEYVPINWNFCRRKPVNFNDPAFRCGYLHKYASIHASLVQYAARRMGSDVFVRMFESVLVPKICCLGGGPGTEVFGLSALFSSLTEFNSKVFHFDIVDCMIGWKTTFASVLEASFQYGSLGSFMSCVTSTYLEADMLSHITNRVQGAISNADLVTMVKFVSAAASDETPRMLTNVFTLMKPGAAVLFIDFAGGEFYELVLNAACRCGFTSLRGPFRHMRYEHEAFRRKMFGSFGLSCVTVAVQMWEKKFPITLNAYESHLISEQLLDLTTDITDCSQRSSVATNSKPQKKNKRRHRSAPRNHSRTSFHYSERRSNSHERSSRSAAREQSEKSQTFQSDVVQSNRNVLSISDERHLPYLITGSHSHDIYADKSKFIRKQSSDSPSTLSTASEDLDSRRSSSESAHNGQYKCSDESPRSWSTGQNDNETDCCCIIS